MVNLWIIWLYIMNIMHFKNFKVPTFQNLFSNFICSSKVSKFQNFTILKSPSSKVKFKNIMFWKILMHLFPTLSRVEIIRFPRKNIVSKEFAFSCIFEVLLHKMREPTSKQMSTPDNFPKFRQLAENNIGNHF